MSQKPRQMTGGYRPRKGEKSRQEIALEKRKQQEASPLEHPSRENLTPRADQDRQAEWGAGYLGYDVIDSVGQGKWAGMTQNEVLRAFGFAVEEPAPQAARSSRSRRGLDRQAGAERAAQEPKKGFLAPLAASGHPARCPIQVWQVRFERLEDYFLPDSTKTRVLRHFLGAQLDELDDEVRDGPIDYQEEQEAYDRIVADLGIDPDCLNPLHKRDVQRIIKAWSLYTGAATGGTGANGASLEEEAERLGDLLVKRWKDRCGEPCEEDWLNDGAGEARHRWPRGRLPRQERSPMDHDEGDHEADHESDS